MTPEQDQYNTNIVMRGRKFALGSAFVVVLTEIQPKKGLVSGTQVVLQWHATGLLKT
jgi:hypothetical protein